ncbi:hypothetical protein TEMA_09570 [Terrisporobacter mayombei]|uniref:Uncharacterized protein n=1 Tax=Terrisporobacter mayombei TaxID=1541 RepID=A0ABY9Q0B8_9FIRM|nr:hypothetical protein TEMA_09570 [Terrisporobacter mayombei]
MKILIYTVIAVLILDIVIILARIRATNKK